MARDGFDGLMVEESGEGLKRLLERVAYLETLEYLTSNAPIVGSGVSLKTKTKVFGDSPYTLTKDDFNINGNATAGNIIIQLPTAASAYDAANEVGDIYNIKKINSNANTVTLQGDGAETIDGSNTQVIIFQYDEITVQSNGTSWDVIL